MKPHLKYSFKKIENRMPDTESWGMMLVLKRSKCAFSNTVNAGSGYLVNLREFDLKTHI